MATNYRAVGEWTFPTGAGLVIRGSSTAVIKIVNWQAAVAGSAKISVQRCSSATGGTPGGGVTTAKELTARGSTSATITGYTAAPTLGSATDYFIKYPPIIDSTESYATHSEDELNLTLKDNTEYVAFVASTSVLTTINVLIEES
jgi:hypothetical protein